MKSPLVSIAIVSFNGRRFLEGCLGSLYRQGYTPFEVILVDNGSEDGSIEFVRENFPKAKIIENRENLGFSAANNQAINCARGKYILTLNNDTVMEDGCLKKLLSVAETSEKDVGMWAPKILSMESRGLIDSVGGLLVYPDCLATGRGRGEKDAGQYDKVEEVFIPSACCALYKKEMLDDIGLFDEDFFAYCEDTDLGIRARMAGWRTLSSPEAIVRHYYSGTAGGFSPLKFYLVERNRVWVAVKNLPPGYLFLSFFYTFGRYMVQTYAFIRGKGMAGKFKKESTASKLFMTLLKAYIDAFKKIPAMLLKRKEIQKKRALPPKEIKKWFKKYGISAGELILKEQQKPFSPRRC